MKALLRRLIGELAVWRVFAWDGTASTPRSAPLLDDLIVEPVSRESIERAPDPLLTEQAWYCGAGSKAFGCLSRGVTAGLCFYWHGDRYSLGRFWPLRPREAMLMQIVTASAYRGRGVARTLIERSARELRRQGFERLFARVWLTNAPSAAAFRHAGWRQVAWIIEVNPFRRSVPWRVKLPWRR